MSGSSTKNQEVELKSTNFDFTERWSISKSFPQRVSGDVQIHPTSCGSIRRTWAQRWSMRNDKNGTSIYKQTGVFRATFWSTADISLSSFCPEPDPQEWTTQVVNSCRLNKVSVELLTCTSMANFLPKIVIIFFVETFKWFYRHSGERKYKDLFSWKRTL